MDEGQGKAKRYWVQQEVLTRALDCSLVFGHPGNSSAKKAL